MITTILRIFLTRSFKPFVFKGGIEEIPDLDVNNLGMYIHIPFCKELCSFCPYYKVKYDRKLVRDFTGSLLKEIELVAGSEKDRIRLSSIYFGGGSPALAAEYLPGILSKIRSLFNISGSIGIELHPQDINKKLLYDLRNTGFDMVSIGVQSFNKRNLLTLGREIINTEEKVRMAARAGFIVVDTDLIFGIPGQTPDDIAEDFKVAANCGATQISTYPFIEFSYSSIKHKPADRKMQKKMLGRLTEISGKAGFKRGSVWTFLKKGSRPYSSITRDNYIGLGPSAATLTRELFKINTFSVSQYNMYLSEGRLPTALTLRFDDRRRALYWLFWSSYNLQLDQESFRELMGYDLESIFGFELLLGQRLGLFRKNKKGYRVTEKGTGLYHMVEQVYTHQYIDKTWRISREDPWPRKLVLY